MHIRREPSHADFPVFVRRELSPADAAQGTFWNFQRALILQTLQAADWVVGGPGGAAERLGLKRTTLVSKMKKLRISRPGRQNNTNRAEM